MTVGVAVVCAAALPAAAESKKLRVRKSVTALSQTERAQFVDALLALKRAPSPYNPRLSWYDQFVAWHVELSRCSPFDPTADRQQLGHAGPIFLPWHREFVLLLENALRKVSHRRITVPYWDWTDPASVDAVFAEDFMGGDGDPDENYAVTTGAFRKGAWRLDVRNEGLVYGRASTSYLVRRLGAPAELPTEAQVLEAMSAPHYDVAPWNDASDPSRSFRNALEGYRHGLPVSLNGCMPDGWLGTVPVGESSALHNLVHQWVGGQPLTSDGEGDVVIWGTMTANLASPNDPVFFLHHANIDRIWAQWQDAHRGASYLPAQGEYRHNDASDLMEPFDLDGIRVTPRDVEDVRALGYRYAGRRLRLAAPRSALVCTRATVERRR